MGRYYGIQNLSKNQGIVSYWKGNPPDIFQLKKFAKLLKWDLINDFIISTCYCNCYKYDPIENNWTILYEYDIKLNENWEYFDNNCNVTNDLTFYCN